MRIQHSKTIVSHLIQERPDEKMAFDAVRKQFSVLDPNRYAKAAFRNHWWDGRHYVISEKGVFLRGLADDIVTWLAEKGVTCASTPYRSIHPELAGMANVCPLNNIELWEHQRRLVIALLANGGGTIESTTGSGKTEAISLLIKLLFGGNTVPRIFFIVHLKGLMAQTRDRFVSRVPELDGLTGLLGDGERPEAKDRVIFCTVQSLATTLGLRKNGNPDETVAELWSSATHVIVDECHHVPSEQYLDVMRTLENVEIYQFSGTPEIQDQHHDWSIIGVGGPIVCRVQRPELEAKGIIAKSVALLRQFGSAKMTRTKGWMPKKEEETFTTEALRVSENGDVEKITVTVDSKKGVEAPGKEEDRLLFTEYARDSILLDESRNQDIAQFCEACLQINRRVVVLCERIAQVYLINAILSKRFKTAVVYGKHSLDERSNAKERFSLGEIDVLVGSTIFDEGEDIQNVGAVVLAAGGSSFVRQVQRIGRGSRKKVGMTNWCPVWFPVDFKNKFTRDQSMERLEYLEVAKVTSEMYEGADWVAFLKEAEARYGA